MEDKESISKDNKNFTAFVVESIRDVVDVVHENNISREDIVTVLREKEGYVVLCYK